MAKPEVNDIRDDKEQLEHVWAETHEQWAEIDSFTDGSYRVWSAQQQAVAPRNTERTNLGRIIIDHTADNLLPYRPKFKRAVIGHSENAQENSDLVEEMATSLWIDASKEEMFLPTKMAGRSMLKYNYAVLETGFNMSSRAEEPDKDDPMYEAKMREYENQKLNFNPFWLAAPHPFSILLPPMQRQPDLAVKRTKWARRDLKQFLERKKEQDEDNLIHVQTMDSLRDGYEQIEVIQHYTPDYFSLMSDEAGPQILLQEENLHRIVPFAHAWGGFGDMTTGEDGMCAEKLGHGLLRPIRDLLRQYDQVRSAKMELYMKAAYGMLVTRGDALELAQQLAEGGNAIIGGVDVREMGFLPIPTLPGFLADLEQKIFQEIVLGTVPLASFGMRDIGVDTVGQHAMMLQVSYKRFIETMEQLSYMVSQTVGLWFRMLATWGDPITLNGIRLSPSMLQGSYDIETSFPLSDEAVRMQRVQQGASLVSQGLKSRKRHWEEDQMLDNISAETDQILEEHVLADPVLMTALAEKKRRELGLAELYAEQTERMSQERMQGFAQTQAQNGMAGFTPPATEEDGQVRQALTDEVLRPAPAAPGAGQMG